MNAVITIAEVKVRIDAQGRYSLNDLHRAAGGEDRHKPGNRIQNQQTKDLITEIEIAGIPAIESKQGLGTFAAREMVYSYAMWISPSFNLKVIRAYDRLANCHQQLQVPKTLPEALRLAADQAEQIAMKDAQLAIASPKVEALERICEADGLLNPTGAAKALQVQPKRVFDYLRTNGWTYRRAGAKSDVAYQDKIAAGLLTHKVHVARREDGSEKVCEQVMVTPKGLAKLAQVLDAH